MTEDAKRRARPRQQELVQFDSPDDIPWEGQFRDDAAADTGRAKSNVIIDNPDDAEP